MYNNRLRNRKHAKKFSIYFELVCTTVEIKYNGCATSSYLKGCKVMFPLF